MSVPGGSQSGSSGLKAAAPKKIDTLCKYITIYGHCRFAGTSCIYNHEVKKPVPPSGLTIPNNSISSLNEKRFNVDSPTFTPASHSKTSSTKGSPLVASAKIWQPKNTGSTPLKPGSRAGTNGYPSASTLSPARAQTHGLQPNPFGSPSSNPYQKYDHNDHTTSSFNELSITDLDGFPGQSRQANGHRGYDNPYHNLIHDNTSAAIGLYTSNPTFQQQGPQWHLYAPIGPYNDNLSPEQKRLHKFFIPDSLRETVQMRMEACNKNLPESALLPQFDKWHSLMPLDTTTQRSTTSFGLPSWVYRATSLEDSGFYALRRLEGIRTADEKVNRSINWWKRVVSAHVVKVHDAFITTAFGDSSLIVVTDYHSCSKTVAEEYFTNHETRNRKINHGLQVPEPILSSYIAQLASAMHVIHTSGLAVRNFDASKILITDKNHIRLNGCALTDALQQGYRRPATELMLEDFPALGRLILGISNRAPNAGYSNTSDFNQLTKSLPPRLRQIVTWLMTPQSAQTGPKTADQFLKEIAPELSNTYDMMSQKTDHVYSRLGREIENGRLLRLIFKMNTINERPEYEGDPRWSETGDRYLLKLFRDYVWHQVDENGSAVLNLGHIISCMNKLDVGTDELLKLVSRDEQTAIIVSYKHLKKATAGAFSDLQKSERQA